MAKKKSNMALIILVLLAVVVVANNQQKEGTYKKTAPGFPETLWGYVYYPNGSQVIGASVTATVYGSADGDPDTDVFYAVTRDNVDPIYQSYLLEGIQLFGDASEGVGERLVVEATYGGMYGINDTIVRWTTPHRTDVYLTTAPPPPPASTIAFRTSVRPYNWTNTVAGDWILTDVDGDGTLEARGRYTAPYTTWSYCADSYRSTYPIVGYTPEGYIIIKYASQTYVYVCDSRTTRRVRFDLTSTKTNLVDSTTIAPGYEDRERYTNNVCTSGSCCTGTVYKSAGTSCGTQSCMWFTTLCRTYSDTPLTCTGYSSQCLGSANLCTTYVDRPFGTLCTGGICSSGLCDTITTSEFQTYSNNYIANTLTLPNYIVYGTGWLRGTS